MKICLFGATGLLGSAFKKVLKSKNFELLAPNRGEVQLLDFEGTLDYLETQSPDLIINCAAYTNVDQAESDAENCEQLNVDVVRNLAKSGIPMIHFSTDYVFDAPENFEIPEDYPKKPQSVYGKSKAQAEEVLEKSEIDWWNIRTSWLFGDGEKNFVATILRLAKNKDEISIINDQIGRPTYAADLAEFVVKYFLFPMSPPLSKGARGIGRSLPYNLKLKEKARALRNNQTEPEKKIWNQCLTQDNTGFRFLRQKPIDNFIVDFYCSELQMVIEIDGDSHAKQAEYDAERTQILESFGLKVLRYTNQEVMNNFEGVKENLYEIIQEQKIQIPPTPFDKGEKLKVPPPGHYHLQNSGNPVSWADFARYFLSLKNWSGKVKNISTQEYDAPAPRPKNSVLKNTKLETNLRDWKEAITNFMS